MDIIIVSQDGIVMAKEKCSHIWNKIGGVFHKGKPWVGIKGEWLRACTVCGNEESHKKGPVLFGWYTIKDKLRTFKIEYSKCKCSEGQPAYATILYESCKAICEVNNNGYEVGSIHKAELINDLTVRIIS